jgi:2-dehydropantoate 2-reductase
MADTIGIVGGGALGTLLMTRLAGHGVPVLAVVRSPARVAALRRDAPAVRLVPDAESLRPASLVFLCIKAYDTAAAAPALRALELPRTAICSLQNGWGNLETLEAALPGAPLIAGTTALGAWLDDSGALHASTEGATRLATWGTTPPVRAEEAAAVLRGAGFAVETRTDPRAMLWRKLTLNAAVNPLTALAMRPNGALLEEPSLVRLSECAALEAARVGARLGHVPADWDPRADLRALLAKTRANRSSMSQDLARGRRTEIDAIAGAVVQAAESAGEPAPVLRALHALVRAAEAGAAA